MRQKFPLTEEFNKGHLLESGDLKTAFLSGDPDPACKGSVALCTDKPSYLKRWWKLGRKDELRKDDGTREMGPRVQCNVC